MVGLRRKQLQPGGRSRAARKPALIVLLSVLTLVAALGTPQQSAKAAWPARVFINHPYPYAGCVYADYHNYTEGYSGANKTIYPADTSLRCGQGTGWQVVHIDMWGLPAGSSVRFDSYVSNRSACNGPSGNRHIVDIWVQPPGRPSRYLGYMVYTHTTSDRNGSWTISDSDWDGRVVDWVAYVWPGNGVPVVVNGYTCWTGPHIHMTSSRDLGYERTYGSSTTNAGNFYGPNWGGSVDAHHELFWFDVDWDWIHY